MFQIASRFFVIFCFIYFLLFEESIAVTRRPTKAPTLRPTRAPTKMPTKAPTINYYIISSNYTGNESNSIQQGTTVNCEKDQSCLVYCNNEYACQNVILNCPYSSDSTNSYSCIIYCNSAYSCSEMYINAQESSYVNLTCNGGYSCNNIMLNGPELANGKINVQANGNYSLNGSSIYSQLTSYTTVNCLKYRSCQYLTIYGPDDSQVTNTSVTVNSKAIQAFQFGNIDGNYIKTISLSCGSYGQSCQNATINAPYTKSLTLTCGSNGYECRNMYVNITQASTLSLTCGNCQNMFLDLYRVPSYSIQVSTARGVSGMIIVTSNYTGSQSGTIQCRSNCTGLIIYDEDISIVDQITCSSSFGNNNNICNNIFVYCEDYYDYYVYGDIDNSSLSYCQVSSSGYQLACYTKSGNCGVTHSPTSIPTSQPTRSPTAPTTPRPSSSPTSRSTPTRKPTNAPTCTGSNCKYTTTNSTKARSESGSSSSTSGGFIALYVIISLLVIGILGFVYYRYFYTKKNHPPKRELVFDDEHIHDTKKGNPNQDNFDDFNNDVFFMHGDAPSVDGQIPMTTMSNNKAENKSNDKQNPFEQFNENGKDGKANNDTNPFQ